MSEGLHHSSRIKADQMSLPSNCIPGIATVLCSRVRLLAGRGQPHTRACLRAQRQRQPAPVHGVPLLRQGSRAAAGGGHHPAPGRRHPRQPVHEPGAPTPAAPFEPLPSCSQPWQPHSGGCGRQINSHCQTSATSKPIDRFQSSICLGTRTIGRMFGSPSREGL